MPVVDGPAVYQHRYFLDKEWYDHMFDIWDDNFGFVQELHQSAVVINMMGCGNAGMDDDWRDVALQYAMKKGFGVFFFRLNPVSKLMSVAIQTFKSSHVECLHER